MKIPKQLNKFGYIGNYDEKYNIITFLKTNNENSFVYKHRIEIILKTKEMVFAASIKYKDTDEVPAGFIITKKELNKLNEILKELEMND